MCSRKFPKHRQIFTAAQEFITLKVLPCTELKSEWKKALNIKTETGNLLEDGVCKTFEDTGVGKAFMNKTQSAQALLQRINNETSPY